MDNLTFGKYIPGNSFIHRLNPTVKIVILIVLMVCVFLVPISATFVLHNFIILGSFLLVVLFLILLARIPFLQVLSSISPLAFLIFFTAIIQLLTNQSGTIIFSWNFNLSYYAIILIVLTLTLFLIFSKYLRFRAAIFLILFIGYFIFQYYISAGTLINYRINIFDSSLIRTAYLIIRVLIIILLSSLLTHTTSTIGLNNGFSGILAPLRLLKIKTDDLAMMMSLVIRFIPTLLIETNKIIKAQSARGADFFRSGIFKKVKILISLLVPIFVISITKAYEMADTMSVRGYNLGVRRSSIDKFTLRVSDYLTLIFGICGLAAMISLRVLGVF
ncbi:MAG: energy-coupling factor transporter transmembrane protein EcfT [Acholeplasmatales bacterium]|jgi:energy-coupling factor transport system permease protein|nr:energy-coupling factor transporter transmembrane protein EcfT [Acholeplasmatales bacterium]